MINIKNLGLQYYSDLAISQTSFVTMPAGMVMTPCIGQIIDKYGVRIVYRIIVGLTIVNVIAFYLLMDNI